MTYNVHGCIGLDGKHAPERIVALQEVYSGDPRPPRETGGVVPRGALP
jgi:hypothetical protein